MQHAHAYSAGAAIRQLERDNSALKAEVARLKAELAAARTLGTPHPEWMSDLTASQQRLMFALMAASPQPVDRFDLLLATSGEDSDACLGVLSVQVHLIHKRIGKGAIEGVRGVGYRLGARLRKPQGRPA